MVYVFNYVCVTSQELWQRRELVISLRSSIFVFLQRKVFGSFFFGFFSEVGDQGEFFFRIGAGGFFVENSNYEVFFESDLYRCEFEVFFLCFVFRGQLLVVYGFFRRVGFLFRYIRSMCRYFFFFDGNVFLVFNSFFQLKCCQSELTLR